MFGKKVYYINNKDGLLYEEELKHMDIYTCPYSIHKKKNVFESIKQKFSYNKNSKYNDTNVVFAESTELDYTYYVYR